MSRFKLSAPARQDLREIMNFIAQDSVPAARRLLTRFTDAFWGISKMPAKGHLREDLSGLPVRFWPVGSYLIVYDPARRPVEILRVLHGARDVQRLLDDE